MLIERDTDSYWVLTALADLAPAPDPDSMLKLAFVYSDKVMLSTSPCDGCSPLGF